MSLQQAVDEARAQFADEAAAELERLLAENKQLRDTLELAKWGIERFHTQQKHGGTLINCEQSICALLGG